MKLSPSQEAIVNAPQQPLCVIACPGSGKTLTAVFRLLKLREQYTGVGYITLLSFTKVAVQEFRDRYQSINNVNTDKVVIETFDSFLFNNIVKPFGDELIKPSRKLVIVSPELMRSDFFRFQIDGKSFSYLDIDFDLDNDKVVYFVYTKRNGERIRKYVDSNFAKDFIKSKMKNGYLTYNMIKLISYVVLKNNEYISRFYSNRFPIIIIDEAQDLGSSLRVITNLLTSIGCSITLIGDPCQAIYGFNGADPEFLIEYSNRPDVLKYTLAENYRSAEPIIYLLNSISDVNLISKSEIDLQTTGLFYTTFSSDNCVEKLREYFLFIDPLTNVGDRKVVLARGHKELFDFFSILKRDSIFFRLMSVTLMLEQMRFLEAKELFNNAVFEIIHRNGNGIIDELKINELSDDFILNTSNGYPRFNSKVYDWYDGAAKSFNDFFMEINIKFPEYIEIEKLSELMLNEVISRVLYDCEFDVIHQVKGESIEHVVIVLSNESSFRSLFSGPVDDEGRLGYVALSRARKSILLLLSNEIDFDYDSALIELGFKQFQGNF